MAEEMGLPAGCSNARQASRFFSSEPLDHRCVAVEISVAKQIYFNLWQHN